MDDTGCLWGFFCGEIQEVDGDTASQIIADRRPLGRFWYRDPAGGFIAIDNQDGNAWTEEFRTKAMATKYLNGHLCYDLHGQPLNG